MIFKNRNEAGELLAKKLNHLRGEKNILILGVPRGGVVVAKEVAEYLKAPLDIIVTRKIGHPLNPEYAIAAVDEDSEITVGIENLDEYGTYLKEEKEMQKLEIKRRLKEYRGADSHPDFIGKTCIIVDDGIATGLTTLSAIRFIRSKKPAKIVLAVPVIPKEIMEKFKSEVDDLIYLDAPEIFFAVGQYYEDFPQVEDEEVKEILSFSIY